MPRAARQSVHGKDVHARSALRRIEQRLKRRDVAAFVMEPISINLGVLIPEQDAIREGRDLCRRYGTVFIANRRQPATHRFRDAEHVRLEVEVLAREQAARPAESARDFIGAVIATASIAQSLSHGDALGQHALARVERVQR